MLILDDKEDNHSLVKILDRWVDFKNYTINGVLALKTDPIWEVGPLFFIEQPHFRQRDCVSFFVKWNPNNCDQILIGFH